MEIQRYFTSVSLMAKIYWLLGHKDIAAIQQTKETKT